MPGLRRAAGRPPDDRDGRRRTARAAPDPGLPGHRGRCRPAPTDRLARRPWRVSGRRASPSPDPWPPAWRRLGIAGLLITTMPTGFGGSAHRCPSRHRSRPPATRPAGRRVAPRIRPARPRPLRRLRPPRRHLPSASPLRPVVTPPRNRISHRSRAARRTGSGSRQEGGGISKGGASPGRGPRGGSEPDRRRQWARGDRRIPAPPAARRRWRRLDPPAPRGRGSGRRSGRRRGGSPDPRHRARAG